MFVHLHVHDDGSLLDGLSTPKGLASRAHELGMSAIAETNHGSLINSLSFASSCRDAGIKPIIGMEAYLALGSRFERNSIMVDADDPTSGEGEKTKRYEHITLLAQNKTGWASLVSMFNASHDSYWYVPRIDYDLMSEHTEGIICMTGCLGGPILGPLSRDEKAKMRWDYLKSWVMERSRELEDPKAVRELAKAFVVGTRFLEENAAKRSDVEFEGGDTSVFELNELKARENLEQLEDQLGDNVDIAQAMVEVETLKKTIATRSGNAEARANLEHLIAIYGADHVFVEVMEHGINVEQPAILAARDLANELGVAIVATNDSHFTNDCDATAHDGWLATRTTGGKLDTPGRFQFHGEGYWLRTEEEMRDLHHEDWWQEACDNTVKVAAMVDDWVLPEYGGVRLPSFPLPEGETDHFQYLIQLVKKGARERYGSPLPKDVKARLNREARVIRDLGLVDYFLIDHDLIEWAVSDWTAQDWVACAEGRDVPSPRKTKKPILVGPGRGCVRGDTLVLTSGGYRLIEDVKIGDHVMGHSGKWRKVLNRFTYDCDEPLLRLRTRLGNGVAMTHDHKVLVMGTHAYTPEWVRADKIKVGDYLCVPRESHQLDQVMFEFSDEDCAYFPVIEIDEVASEGLVYDIETAVDHSYMTDSYLIHNSGAGSIILYALGIVNVDPLRHSLFFERFLDPTRVGMPDVDTDFERDRRDECYDFLVARYGANQIARLGAVGKKKTKAAIQSGCSIVGISETYANRLTKLIPDGLTVAQLLDPKVSEGNDFRREIESTNAPDTIQTALDYAVSFDGLVASEGIHACGVMVADKPVDDEIPMRANRRNPDGPRITTWDGREIDGLGLLKLDCLGLRTLDIIHTCIDIVNRTTRDNLTYEQLPDPDSDEASVGEAWAMLRRGETAGVFQLSSSGMTELIEQIEPRCWDHITAANALYRPGPLAAGMHIQYADRLNGREVVDYGIFSQNRDPDEIEVIEGVLGETFGIPVYQEQAMSLGREVAGFGDAMVNKLRKAISKKKVEEFPALGEAFTAGATRDTNDAGQPKQVFAASTAQALWRALEGSAHYSFNKSHSAAYALIGFQTAWLKSTYPAPFGAAVLTHTDRAKTVERSAIMNSMTAMGIDILPPDINLSSIGTDIIDDHTIVLGFTDIKDIGSAGDDIVAERTQNGPFTSLADLITRVPPLNKTNITALIETGCLDSFGPRKGHTVVASALAAYPDIEIPDVEWGPIERWIGQKKRIGLAFGTHPIDVVGDAPVKWTDSKGRRVERKPAPLSRVYECEDGDHLNLLAAVGSVATKQLNSGQAAFITLESPEAVVDGAVWPRALKKVGLDALAIGTVLVVSGTVKQREVETEDGDTQVKAELWVNNAHVVPVSDEPDEKDVDEIVWPSCLDHVEEVSDVA